MKALFLDIDGVLNKRDDFKASPHACHVLNSEMVSRLNRIVEKSKCKVVLSSSWRYIGLDKVDALLKGVGFLFDLHSLTMRDQFDFARGAEIRGWMKANNVLEEDIVILDDDTDMLDLGDRLVKTSMETGLLDCHVEQALRLFGIV